MILILSKNFDISTDKVISWIPKYVSVHRINAEERVKVIVTNNFENVTLIHGQGRLSLNKAKSVFDRKGSLNLRRYSSLPRLNNEVESLKIFFYSFLKLKTFCIGDSLSERDINRLNQYLACSQSGLKTPMFGFNSVKGLSEKLVTKSISSLKSLVFEGFKYV